MNDEARVALAKALYHVSPAIRRGTWENLPSEFQAITLERATAAIAELDRAGWVLGRRPEYVTWELNHKPAQFKQNPIARPIGAPIVATVQIKRRPWYRRIF